jgi:hypothetical protein
MWDLIEELGEQQKIRKNIELKVNGAIIHDPKAIADVFNEYYTNIARHMLSAITREIRRHYQRNKVQQ